ncbi:hypothetical protein JVT61DRAFT_8822 [Boletus reticuloceps]|uniref:Uncharacterized protein n=1 Tax=Boletus reticuloceps TaxID=495285 RepID=A0A8I3A6L2_9AGAM|nr:hypothetical protein JVT61DRAFT_8822 [Boletus reticuloceps]
MQTNVFVSPPNTKALITLILIENSQAMFSSWNDLRQHYLPTLLGSMRIANPVVPIPVLWLTTAPVGDDATSLHSAPPRQYNQLPDLKFSFSPDNRITSRIVTRATELMLEAATQFQGGPINFHLFIVTASVPIHGTWGVSPTMPTQIGQSEWRLLGQRIAQLNIHCHMILPASQDMFSMNELFTTSLELQGHTRVSSWFPTNPDYTFLLSGDPSALDPPTIESVEQQPLFPVVRPPVLRHQSFPQDVQSTPPPAPAPAQNGSTPSLVSSLQKVHGLSRKKLYGTQPPRQPFVREEPVRTKYKSSPTPLSIPVGSQQFPIPDEPRAVSKTKVERGRRADRPQHIGDLSNSTSPGRRSPWNCVSSSDIGSSPSSPTASHHTTSPTIPLYPAGYPTSTPPVTAASFSSNVVAPVPIPETSPLLDPSGSYFSISPSFQSPPLSVTSQGPAWTPMSMPTSTVVPMAKPAGMPCAVRRHSQELPRGSHMQSLTAMSSKYRLDCASPDPRPIPKNTQKVKDAGDVPFIFSPELVAATTAKLKAALQSTPTSSTMAMNQFPVFTSGTGLNYGATTEDAYDALSQLSPRPFGYDAVQDTTLAMTAMLTNGHGHMSRVVDGEPHPRRFVGNTSSSLQGWAG